MSIVETLFLVGSIIVFCCVGAVIAYGQRQTELAQRARRDDALIVPSAESSGTQLSPVLSVFSQPL